MDSIERLLARSAVHDQWCDLLARALATLDPDYLESLLADDRWLPGADQLLAAFRRDRLGLRYLLVGESPYPRRESANGIAFQDAAVGSIWSDQGLSKPVNRATSLRNILKLALLAEGHLEQDPDGRIPQSRIAEVDKTGLIRNLDQFFANLQDAGFLLLNATPVLHDERKPAQEAKFWQPFLASLLASISAEQGEPATLVLWGRIAQVVDAAPASKRYRKLACEHPYNVSFIDNPDMQQLFAKHAFLRDRDPGLVAKAPFADG